MNSTPRSPSHLAPWFLGALAAMLAFLCAWLVRLCVDLRAQNTLLQHEQSLSALELRAVRNQLEAERILAARERADLAKKSGTKPAETAPPPR